MGGSGVPTVFFEPRHVGEIALLVVDRKLQLRLGVRRQIDVGEKIGTLLVVHALTTDQFVFPPPVGDGGEPGIGRRV